MPEPLTDDQHTRLRELAEQFGRARFAPAYEFTGNDLLALLDEIDRLGDRIADLELDHEGLQRTLAENDRLREDWQEQYDRAERADARSARMIDLAERAAHTIDGLIETVRAEADVLQQDGRLRGALVLRDACDKAEKGS